MISRWGRGVVTPLIARFMKPIWGPSGADRTQVGPMMAPWILLRGSGYFVQSLAACEPVCMIWPWGLSLHNSGRSIREYISWKLQIALSCCELSVQVDFSPYSTTILKWYYRQTFDILTYLLSESMFWLLNYSLFYSDWRWSQKTRMMTKQHSYQKLIEHTHTHTHTHPHALSLSLVLFLSLSLKHTLAHPPNLSDL